MRTFQAFLVTISSRKPASRHLITIFFVWSLIPIFTDVKGLAKRMIRTINARASHTPHRCMLHEYKDDTNMKQALQSCADQYDAIIKGDIPLSLQALRSGDYKFSERGTMDLLLLRPGM